MVVRQAQVRVLDASGAGWVQVFHLYGGSRREASAIGLFVKGAVNRVAFYPRPRRGKRYRPLRVGHIVRGLVTQARYASRFFDGARCHFLLTAIAVLRRRGLFRSKAVHGPLSRLVRRRQYEELFTSYV